MINVGHKILLLYCR